MRMENRNWKSSLLALPRMLLKSLFFVSLCHGQGLLQLLVLLAAGFYLHRQADTPECRTVRQKKSGHLMTLLVIEPSLSQESVYPLYSKYQCKLGVWLLTTNHILTNEIPFFNKYLLSAKLWDTKIVKTSSIPSKKLQSSRKSQQETTKVGWTQPEWSITDIGDKGVHCFQIIQYIIIIEI